MLILVVIVGSIACAVGGQLSLKAGMNRVGRVGRSSEMLWSKGLPAIVLGLGFYGLSTLLWLYTLSQVDLSYAFPFVSLSYVAIIFAARFGLGEELHPSRLLGSAIIVSGVLLVSLS